MDISSKNSELTDVSSIFNDTPAADTKQLAEEISAMEAVRELLFGQRVGELHQRMQTTEDRFSTALQNADGIYGQRFQSIETNLLVAETKLSQRLMAEQRDRVTQDEAAAKLSEERFSALEQRLASFMSDCQRQFQMLATDISLLRKDLQAEASYLKQSMPTVSGLADLFRSTADRMRSSLAPDPAKSAPAEVKEAGALSGLSA